MIFSFYTTLNQHYLPLQHRDSDKGHYSRAHHNAFSLYILV